MRGERGREGSEGRQEVVTTSCLEVALLSALQLPSCTLKVRAAGINLLVTLIPSCSLSQLHNLYFKLQYTENRSDSRRSLTPQDLWESGMWKRTWGPSASPRDSSPQALQGSRSSPGPDDRQREPVARGVAKEGLPSGRRAINNPEAIASAALFKDGGGGTSAAEAGATGQRLRRYERREGCPARASGGRPRPAVPEELGESGPRGRDAACDGALPRVSSPPPHNGSRAAATPGRAGRPGPGLGLSRTPGAEPGPPRLRRSRGLEGSHSQPAGVLADKPRPRPGPSC